MRVTVTVTVTVTDNLLRYSSYRKAVSKTPAPPSVSGQFILGFRFKHRCLKSDTTVVGEENESETDGPCILHEFINKQAITMPW
jgi:hypothetical protein